jgi:cytochrome P450
VSTPAEKCTASGGSPSLTPRVLAGNSIAAAPDGAQHRKQRDVLSPSFRTDYIRNLVPSFTR